MKIRQAIALLALWLTATAGCSGPPTEKEPETEPATSESAGSSQESQLHCDQLPFVENVYWTTDYGPARADVRSGPGGFLPCNTPTYALCYYSGADPLPCKVDAERGIAECECYGYQEAGETYGSSILINGILNTCAYIETVRDCGHDGAGCTTEVNSAPACQYMNQSPQMLWPGADLISTFSLAREKEQPIGCTPCNGVYAGCMTAPCYNRKNEQGEDVVICECPLYKGPYQVGQNGVSCEAGEGLVWSAAYNPSGCPN